ncbi:hypothetical protein FTO70_06755 [Methanosarcina sp. KYL-1]|uniref:hypothetical protein n=1 Tax=Methanosarcina sp. KYL-1 TaxID=2602068 RepID=UPI0021019613|nr:hypothetical protein [Methanosarcina sp. KYL-1]MCQ1535392.1 hypothetical protein [Methanosarcina sp. KYL-1]
MSDPQKEHIHFISAGESIGSTFKKTIKDSGYPITRAVVIVEGDILIEKKEDDDYRKSTKQKIRDAINEVKYLCEYFEIEFELKEIPQISSNLSLNSVRDSVLEILEIYPGSKYYFNISGGGKILSIGLFLMSLWVEGISYHVDRLNHFQKLSVPKMHVKDISKNPNYVYIMEIISKSSRRPIPRKELLGKFKAKKGDNNTEKEFGGILTKHVANLINWGLVRESFVKGNKKEKEYDLTDDGIFALNFIKLQSQ